MLRELNLLGGEVVAIAERFDGNASKASIKRSASLPSG